jgi:hypothetical protein
LRHGFAVLVCVKNENRKEQEKIFLLLFLLFIINKSKGLLENKYRIDLVPRQVPRHESRHIGMFFIAFNILSVLRGGMVSLPPAFAIPGPT